MAIRYHVFPFLRWKGVRYKMLAHRDHRLVYFEDQTLMGEILEVLDRKWYKRLIRWPWMAWEIEADHQQIGYYFWAPNEDIGNEIRRKILGQHPDMEITVVERGTMIDYSDAGFQCATTMGLDRAYPVPIKSFYNEVVDSQAAIVHSLSELEEGQRCLIQVLIQPARNYEDDFENAMKIVKSWKVREEEYKKLELFETNIAGKKTRQLAHCSFHLLAAAKNKKDARRLLDEMTRCFGQFTSEALNSFKPRERWMHLKPLLLFRIKRRIFPMKERRIKRVILNIEELSGIIRIPSEKVNNSRLTRLEMKHIEAPSSVLTVSNQVKANGAGVRYLHIGVNQYRMKKNQIYFDLQTASRHVLIGGGSGSGKTVFLNNFLCKLIDAKMNGHRGGFFLIDPFGALAQTVVSNIPDELMDLVTYVQPDPSESTHFPLNVFDVDFASTEHSIAKNISDAIGRIWPENWGPRPERNFLLGGIALQRYGEANLINLERLLRDPVYTATVAQFLRHLPDMEEHGVATYFEDLARLGRADAHPQERNQRMSLIESTINKLQHFVLSSLLSGAMGALSCGFRWRQSMDEGRINILDLSKIQNDDEKSMYGSLALTMNYQAAISRPSLDADPDIPLYPLVADELPMFLKANEDVVNDMADQTRQKNVPIIGAAQGIITQLEKKVADAIGRNFSTHIMFRLNHSEDADWIQKQFNDDRLSASDYQKTPPNYAYVKISVDRSVSPPFSLLANPKSYRDIDEEKVAAAAKRSKEEALERERLLIEQMRQQREEIKVEVEANIFRDQELEEDLDRPPQKDRKKSVEAELPAADHDNPAIIVSDFLETVEKDESENDVEENRYIEGNVENVAEFIEDAKKEAISDPDQSNQSIKNGAEDDGHWNL